MSKRKTGDPICNKSKVQRSAKRQPTEVSLVTFVVYSHTHAQVPVKLQSVQFCKDSIELLNRARCSVISHDIDRNSPHWVCPFEFACGENGNPNQRGRKAYHTPADLVLYNKDTGYLNIVYKPIVNDFDTIERNSKFRCALCSKDISDRKRGRVSDFGNAEVQRLHPIEKLFKNQVKICKQCYQTINNGIFTLLKYSEMTPIYKKIETTIEQWMVSQSSKFSSQNNLELPHFTNQTPFHFSAPFPVYSAIVINPPTTDDNGAFSFGGMDPLDSNFFSMPQLPPAIQYETNENDQYTTNLIDQPSIQQRIPLDLLRNENVKNVCVSFARYIMVSELQNLTTTASGMDTIWTNWVNSIDAQQEGKTLDTACQTDSLYVIRLC